MQFEFSFFYLSKFYKIIKMNDETLQKVNELRTELTPIQQKAFDDAIDRLSKGADSIDVEISQENRWSRRIAFGVKLSLSAVVAVLVTVKAVAEFLPLILPATPAAI